MFGHHCEVLSGLFGIGATKGRFMSSSSSNECYTTLWMMVLIFLSQFHATVAHMALFSTEMLLTVHKHCYVRVESPRLALLVC